MVRQARIRTPSTSDVYKRQEKGNAGLALDKRADVVDKCIEQKMKAAASTPAS